MAGIQAKMVRTAKKQENLNHDAEKKQSTETNLELTQALAMVDKGMKHSL